jgi:transcriptional regulator with XRE-family HTH domain
MQPLLLGQRIRELRERDGMSQAALARTLGASINAINMLEVGSTRAPHIDRLIAIADLFGVSLDYLVGLTNEPAPTQKPPRSRKAVSVG